nr:mismatch repair protein [Tranzscheliella williamsii]
MTAEAAYTGSATEAHDVIQPIAASDVHRITSGQVVLDLQTAVKELVENALDAGASNISVHFKDYGAECFEVVDNGSGIDPSNYPSVALKHYTSKLSSFSDLALVRTFGFRGEALASLCALSDVTIHTATNDQAPMGTILQLDRRGRLKDSSKKAARQRGTTITITGLFQPLPVRRKEFEKNLKREYTKTQNLLQAYTLITKGVRWSTTNTPRGGRRTPQFSVNSSHAPDYLLGNVTALFGTKSAATLMPLSLRISFPLGRSSLNPAARAISIPSESDPIDETAERGEVSTVDVVGLISKPTYGSGRNSSDRQFFYINGRPWEAGRVSRAFNEVYKSFNTNQVPFVIADFRLSTDSYDVNVSPDKRTIFLHEESRLIEKVKTGLEQFFAPSRGTFLVNGASHSLRQPIAPFGARPSNSRPPAKRGESTRSGSEQDDPLPQDLETLEPPALEQPSPSQEEARTDGPDSADDVISSGERSRRRQFRERAERGNQDLEYREQSSSPSQEDQADMPAPNTDVDSDPEPVYAAASPSTSQAPPLSSSRLRSRPDSLHPSSEPSLVGSLDDSQTSLPLEAGRRRSKADEENTAAMPPPKRAKALSTSLRSFALPGTQSPAEPMTLKEDEAVPMAVDPGSSCDSEQTDDERGASGSDPTLNRAQRSTMSEAGYLDVAERESWSSEADELVHLVDVSWLRDKLLRQSKRLGLQPITSLRDTETDAEAHPNPSLLTEAGIGSRDEEQIERALSRVIHKHDFHAMQVIGQFNLGFIIARRQSGGREKGGAGEAMDDLFIVDQHASDEKFNFETLQRTTRIRSQKLIVPRPLELSASDELVAIEHQETLLSNGFEIMVSESGLPGTRVKLVAQPISKTTVFGVKDLEELLFLLRDTTPGSEAARAMRCSKARSMFASRACRKSIMIGTALNKRQMKAILTNMGRIEQPWNCPHGRPTMRHLACLKTVAEEQKRELGALAVDHDPTWDEIKAWLP